MARGNLLRARAGSVLLRLAAVLAAVALPACVAAEPVAAPGATREVIQLDVDGQTRTYELFIPSEAEVPSPLVVVLHDAGGSGDTMVQVTQFDRVATVNGFAVAYPEGLDGIWNGGFCCAGADADDIAFLQHALDDLGSHERLDPDRIYVVGVSNGAIMAYRVGCELADRIAGVASVAGTMLLEGCDPARPLSMLAINGTADPLVPFEGGSMANVGATADPPPVVAVAEHWAEANGCPEAPAVSTSDPLITMTWAGCANDTVVRLVTIEGGGHTWYAKEFGAVDGAIDATAEIVLFFDLKS